ncbi:MAG: SpoIIE family protein phosphatase [Kiritimatiellae bacterium]|nr:SpoIIE family protein phosphatase [Kiritimatiellia bacterium]
MSIRKRWRRWFTAFVVVPVFVTLVVINIAVARAIQRRHIAVLEETSAAAAAELEKRLLPEATILHGLSRMPATHSLLAAARRAAGNASRNTRIEEMEKAWAGFGPDAMPVMEVLNNSVGDTLRQIVAGDPAVVMLLLTDGDGALLAASRKTEHYDFSRIGWWQGLRLWPAGMLVSEGLSEKGLLGLALAVPDPDQPNSVLGVLRAEVDIAPVISRMDPVQVEGEWAVSLVDRQAYHLAGAVWQHERMAARIDALLPELQPGAGWLAGTRFYARPLGCGISWARPVSVVALRSEGLYPLSVCVPIAALVLASVVVLLIMTLTSRRMLDKRFLTPTTQLLEAGDWALHNALGRSPELEAPEDGKGEAPRLTPVQKELESWLRQFRHDLDDEVARRTSDMQRDLDLAKDFQMAYLDRPYPKIPAVHIEGRLRLDFYHKYNPALALGGDFFDIMTLAPDCGGVFVADVMGHGTRSALITSILRTLLGDLLSQGRNARHFMTEMNKQFCGLLKSVPSPLFASAFYFVADTTARIATFSSAGHPAPFQIRRSVGRITRLEVPEPRGCALGLMPKETYTGGHCRLIAGDVFVFFTDGVYEAHNRQGEEYGIARMESVLRTLMYKDLRYILDGVLNSLMEFVGDEPLADDICMVAVEVTTSTAKAPGEGG